jgi:hypothetical protein
MKTIVFSAFVLVLLLSFYSNFAMRIRLTRAESSRDKLVWWRSGSSEVAATYAALYPSSHLPQLARFAFWFFAVMAAVALAAILSH